MNTLIPDVGAAEKIVRSVVVYRSLLVPLAPTDKRQAAIRA